MASYQTILFDLDGTLTDPLEGITKGAQYALKHYGIIVEDNTTLAPFIGPPLVDSFMEFYGFPREKALEACKYYREYFRDTGIFQNVPYSGIHSFLASLQKAGKRLFVASSKPEEFVRRILIHFELDSYFEFMGGSEMDGVRGKKAEVIQYVLETNRITDLSHVIMVGDRRHDVEGARECGLDCIGVLYGYGGREELTQAGAIALAADLDELQTLLLAE